MQEQPGALRSALCAPQPLSWCTDLPRCSRYAHSVEAKPVAVRFVATHEKGASAAGGQLDSEQDAEGPGEGLGDDRQAEGEKAAAAAAAGAEFIV